MFWSNDEKLQSRGCRGFSDDWCHPFLHSNLKPRSSPSLEEDEGFSDWTQRRQRRRQQMEELHQRGQQEVEEEEELVRIPAPSPSSTSSSSGRLQEPESEEQDAGKRVGRSRRDPWEMVKDQNQRADTEVRFSRRRWPLEEPGGTSGIEDGFCHTSVFRGSRDKNLKTHGSTTRSRTPARRPSHTRPPGPNSSPGGWQICRPGPCAVKVQLQVNASRLTALPVASQAHGA